MTGNEDRENSLLRLADELSTEIARAGELMRQPLLHREVSIQRVRVMAHLLNQGPLRSLTRPLSTSVPVTTMPARTLTCRWAAGPPSAAGVPSPS